MSGETVEALRVREVVRGIVGACRTSWRDLLVLGLMLFVPLGFLTALAPGEGIEIEHFDDPNVIPVILLGIAQVVAPLIGTVFFAGIAASAVMRHREGHSHDAREMARTLPYGKLVAADVLLVIAMAFGLLLFIVPGVLALVWFCLVAPVIEHEGGSVRAGFRRSRELVRGHFRQVAVLVIPAVLLQALVESAAEELSLELLGHGFVAEWLGAVLGNLFSDPIFALIVVILYLDLKALRPVATA